MTIIPFSYMEKQDTETISNLSNITLKVYSKPTEIQARVSLLDQFNPAPNKP